MGSVNYMVGIVALIILIGLILRYGNSSNALAKDFNGFIALLTLQNPNVSYYGPNS